MSRSGRLALACGVIAVLGCNQADSPPNADLASQEGYVEASDGAKLFYRMLGSGPDTLIVLHGGPGLTMEYFYADLAPLATDHGLLFYDQRGTGKSTLVSDSAGLDAARFVGDLESIRRHFGMEKVVLFGHSWGAGVAALYAQQHPMRVARMVIVGALPLQRSVLSEGFETMAANRDSMVNRRMEELREARRANPADASVCREYYVLWFEPFVADSSALHQSKGDFCAGTSESRRNKMNSVDRYTMASLGDWDWRSSLHTVEAPTLVIHGTIDPLPLEGAREWSRSLPNARILELDGIGHFPYLESPDVFFPAVERFLRGEWPEAARVITN